MQIMCPLYILAKIVITHGSSLHFVSALNNWQYLTQSNTLRVSKKNNQYTVS